MGAVIQAIFVVGMMAGSLVFGFISDMFGRKFCLFLCSALTVSQFQFCFLNLVGVNP